MTDPMPLEQAGARLAELVAQARLDEDGVMLTGADGPVAAIISIETYRMLRATQDAADIALCEASNANPEGSMTMEEFIAVLGAEDAAGR